MHLFVGLAELIGDRVEVAAEPVIVPDIERVGIHIPAFTVFEDRIVGIYADALGPGANRLRDADTDVIFVESRDGTRFVKRAIPAPFRDTGLSRIGLPWILADDRTLRVYWRAKRDGKDLLAACTLDHETGTLREIEILGRFPRNPINIAVTKRRSGYFCFYGATVGGGLYLARSDDGRTFDFDNSVMLVGSDTDWGWDYYKVCGCPDNTQDDEVSVCYMARDGGGPSVGYATFNIADI